MDNELNTNENTYTTNGSVGHEIEGGTQTPQPTVTPTQDGNKEIPKKKKKKGLIIALIILLVIVLAFIIGYVYIKQTHTAEKYIDNTIASAKDYVNDIFGNIASVDTTKYDANINGKLTLSSETPDYEALNDLSLSFALDTSSANDYERIEASLYNKEENILTAILHLVGEEDLYIESEDITTTALKMNLKEMLASEEEDIDEEALMEILNVDTIKEMLLSTIGYLGDAVKQADLKTSFNGMTVSYIYDINNNNINDIKNTFNEKINSDKNYQKITELSGEELDFDLDLEPMKITLEQNILTGKFDRFTIEVDGDITTGERVGEDTYKIVIDDTEYIEIISTDTKIAIVDYIDGKIDTELKMEQVGDNTIYLSISTGGTNIDLTLTSKYNEKDMTGDMAIEFGIDDEEMDLAIKLDMNYKYGEGLVKVNIPTNAKSFDNLTEDEMMNLYTNLVTKMEELEFLGDLFSTESDDEYLDDYNYDYDYDYDYEQNYTVTAEDYTYSF